VCCRLEHPFTLLAQANVRISQFCLPLRQQLEAMSIKTVRWQWVGVTRVVAVHRFPWRMKWGFFLSLVVPWQRLNSNELPRHLSSVLRCCRGYFTEAEVTRRRGSSRFISRKVSFRRVTQPYCCNLKPFIGVLRKD